MGFYSAFATYSSQMATVLMALVTHQLVFSSAGPWNHLALLAAGAFGASALLALLPLVGVGSFVKYEGFCYIDYHNTAHCAVWLLVMVPCVLAVLYYYGAVYKFSALPPKVTQGLVLFWVVFLCGWVLGLPLIFLGLSGSAYPKGLNLTSAVLGHGMNLVNPILYGVFWHDWFVSNKSTYIVVQPDDDRGEASA